MIRQTLAQKQSLRFSPAQIQLTNMLMLPCVAFDEYLANEIEANPAIDASYDNQDSSQEDDFPDNDDFSSDNSQEDAPDKDFDISDYIPEDQMPDYLLSTHNNSPDDEPYTPIGIAQSSFSDYLLEQLSMCQLSDTEQVIGKYIIGNIDPDGYLRRDLLSICDDLAFGEAIYINEQQALKVLNTIQEFDPIGVGGSSLEQCLLIQLRHKDQTPPIELAQRIIEDSFVALGRKNYDKIIEKLACSKDELSDALAEISRLNPKPGAAFATHSASQDIQVIPDFAISIEDNDIEIRYLGAPIPTLKISREYSSMLDHYSHIPRPNRSEKEAITFVKNKIDSAKYFIDAVRQRQNTLMNIMESIAHHQREYILTGDESSMRPLGLKDIATDVSMDMSTISRVVSQKYVDTPYGVLSLKHFFSEGRKNTDGEDVSTREIKHHLQEILEVEDHKNPLTDQQIADILLDKGYKLARRTVAKYREQLSIPAAHLRRYL